MANKITKEFLKEHFRQQDTLTLYRDDGSSFTFVKKHRVILVGGYCKLTFKTYDDLITFYKERQLCLKPVINIG